MLLTESIKVFIYATALLSIKMWLCGTITTYFRGLTMESPNKEDGPIMHFFNILYFIKPSTDFKPLTDGVETDELVNRWVRLCNNDTANIPIGLLVLFLAVFYESMAPTTLVILIWLFVVSRLAHTVTYALAIQPFRTISFAVGSISIFIAAISLLVNI